DNDSLMMARWHAEIAPHLLRVLGDTGKGLLTAELGAKSNVTLTQIGGGEAAKYIIAVNDSHIKSQADWYQVREELQPVSDAAAGNFLYDCTAERALGKVGPLACDLTQCTARVYAVLTQEPKQIALRATQSPALGAELSLSVHFLDASGKTISALIPFALTITRPDGRAHAELYRSTNRLGQFGLSLPLADNLPPGKWTVQVRSQLDGQTVTLPVAISAPAAKPIGAAELKERLVVRQRAAIEAALAKGSKLVLPIFDSPQAEKLLPIAESIKQTLSQRGVDVEIVRAPKQTTFWLAYDLTEAQAADNKLADAGTSFGRIKRETLNGNDWYSGLSGWRFGKQLFLLDLATESGDSPMAESLSKEGLLWPNVTEQFPGQGRAVIEAVPWAFGPRLTAVVLRASDVEGLQAGAAALTKLPDDLLTSHIADAKSALWREYHIGGKPVQAVVTNLTNAGLAVSSAPKPFAIEFPTERPLTFEQINRPAVAVVEASAVPGSIDPKQFVIFLRDTNSFIESATAGMLVPDLRFNDAVQITVNVKAAGKYRIGVPGVYRYSDRKPCWQAQWEDIIELREKLVPKQRQPMQMLLQREGKTLATLKPSQTAEKEVALELASASAGLKPKTAVEEVVTELSAEVDLPAGRQQLLFIHSGMVDGKIEQIMIMPK
ncbi:MAG TPA: hypothetical protein VL096_01815, partial [Pirellulaceae bacterium]|nr:hypothetical protein [Pirellulaceae bacterium]